jgi:hypothetical protein
MPRALNPQRITDQTVMLLKPRDLAHLRVADVYLDHHLGP